MNIKPNVDTNKIISKLLSYGFTTSQITLGLSNASTLNDILDYLCLHLPEDELPKHFRPTGQFEISIPSKCRLTPFIHSYGFKEKDIEKAYNIIYIFILDLIFLRIIIFLIYFMFYIINY